MPKVADTARIDTDASSRKLMQTTGVDPDAEGSVQSEEERVEKERIEEEIRNLRSMHVVSAIRYCQRIIQAIPAQEASDEEVHQLIVALAQSMGLSRVMTEILFSKTLPGLQEIYWSWPDMDASTAQVLRFIISANPDRPCTFLEKKLLEELRYWKLDLSSEERPGELWLQSDDEVGEDDGGTTQYYPSAASLCSDRISTEIPEIDWSAWSPSKPGTAEPSPSTGEYNSDRAKNARGPIHLS